MCGPVKRPRHKGVAGQEGESLEPRAHVARKTGKTTCVDQ